MRMPIWACWYPTQNCSVFINLKKVSKLLMKSNHNHFRSCRPLFMYVYCQYMVSAYTAKFKQDRFSVNRQFLERIIILNPFQ